MVRVVLFMLGLIMTGSVFAGEMNDLSMPDKFYYQSDNETDDKTEIYPVGWSEDGKFAYFLYDDYDDGLGDKTYFYFVIQDLVTDELVYTNYYFKELEITSPDDLWYERPIIEKKLKQYNIEMTEIAYAMFPFTHLGNQYDIDIIWDTVSDELYTPSDYSVQMWKGNKYKTIASDMETYAADLEKYCAFLSPYENRFAVMILEYNPGYEGPPFSVYPIIIGSHATSGFRRGMR